MVLVDTTQAKAEHLDCCGCPECLHDFYNNDNTRSLSEYSNEDKIKWFDEFYKTAEKYVKEDFEHNLKVYEKMFISAAEDILKRRRPWRIYELIGKVVINDYASSKIERIEIGK